jgi:CRISPR-associated RAMP protein (TIGR02581 family)
VSSEPIYSFAALRNRLQVTGQLVTLTALRIGAGRDSDVTSNDLPVLRDALGAPFIPGASLKGAFRARIEAVIRAVAPGQALDLPEIEERMRGGITELSELPDIRNLRRQGQIAAADRRLSAEIWEHSTLIDLTFGAPWVAGRIFFKDALVDRSLWFGQFEVRNGVALNRDTETAEPGLLYDYEVVPAGTIFTFEVVLENAEPWQLGMLLLALTPWEAGDAWIGGFRSRGLGRVQLTTTERRYVEVAPGEAGVNAVMRMFGYGTEGADELIADDDRRIAEWIADFRNELMNRAQKGEHRNA